MSILIFGAGRMGLSHGAMSMLHDISHDVIFIEPDFLTRNLINIFTDRGVSAKKDTRGIDFQKITHAIVASPPKMHQSNVDILKKSGFSGRLLIEKPLLIDVANTDCFSYVMSGYVLKHSYFWSRLLNDVTGQSVKGVTISLETNQDFALGGDNWRSSSEIPEVSLLYEFGSHCVDLLYSIFPDAHLFVAESNNGEILIKDTSIPGVEIRLVSGSNTVRKSIYSITVETNDYSFSTDFYQYSQRNASGNPVTECTLASLGVAATSYLRGFDFATQMAYFLGNEEDAKFAAKSALKVDHMLNQLETDILCLN